MEITPAFTYPQSFNYIPEKLVNISFAYVQQWHILTQSCAWHKHTTTRVLQSL